MSDLIKELSAQTFTTASADSKIFVLKGSLEESSDTLTIEATTYIQRETPNRNFVRFHDKALKRIAKTGVGTPFLKDHAQHLLDARGGTVTKSVVVSDDKGNLALTQTIKLTKRWAIDGVLDGTIDRFSIGWIPKGKITYRHSGKEVGATNEFQYPEHRPGEKLEDGSVVEWVFHEATLVEVSGVNVPAVEGTSIHQIQKAAAQTLSASVETNQGGGSVRRKPKPMKDLLQSLGLDESASEAKAIAAVGQVQTDITKLSAEIDSLKTQLASASDELAARKVEDEARAKHALEADIEGLYVSGKLARDKGVDADPMEKHLRKLYAVGGRELFEEHVGLLTAKAPVGFSQSKGSEPDEKITEVSDARAQRLSQSGMTEERWLELSAKHQRKIQNEWGIK